MPAFSHFFHMHPWDVERLSFDELQKYLKTMNEHVKKIEEAERAAKRMR